MPHRTKARKPVSLLWKILFSTSIAITALFAAMGWLLQRQFAEVAAGSAEEEVRVSFQAYESLWRSRADQLASVSRVLSRMPQVRAAFGTRDRATIHDSAAEAWDQLSHPGTVLLVADPGGPVIVDAGAGVAGTLTDVPFVRAAAQSFPKQATGFVLLNERLYQIVVTPVYVAGEVSPALLNVVVAGIAVDSELGRSLKISTGGSDFVFITRGRVAASTLPDSARQELEAFPVPMAPEAQGRIGGSKYYQFASPLTDVE